MSRPAHTFLPKNKLVAVGIGAIAMLAMATPVLSQETSGTDESFQLLVVYGLTNTGIGNLPTPGAGGFFSFDISWVDPAINKYFLADRSNKSIDILNLATFPPTLTQVVNAKFQGFTGNNDTSGPDGLLTANNHTEVWVGDTGGTCFPQVGTPPEPPSTCGPGQVWVLNIDGSVKTLTNHFGGVTNPIPVGGKTRADELCYDPVNNLIMIASPAEDPPYVTFIHTAGRNAYTVAGKLLFDGKRGRPKATNGIEQCQWSAETGLFYINVPEVNGPGNDTKAGAVAVIDPKTRKVTNVFPVPLEDCAGPQGMAIGPGQILLGCNAKSPNGHRNSLVIDLNSGNTLAVLQDLGGADEVWFNPGDGHYVIPSCNTACRTPPVPFVITGDEVLGLVDSRTLQLDQSVFVAAQNSDTTVTTGNPRTVHSVAADPNNKQIILPIPAFGGTAPQFNPSLCDKTGSGITIIGAPSSTVGCIAVLFAPLNNDVLPSTP